MVSGPVDPDWVKRLAEDHGYHSDSFERAYRLAHLLRELGEHDWLKDRLALKGGTCINFFHTDLPRLSVDMDLNYVGAVDKASMKEERPQVEQLLTELAGAHGYEVDVERASYAGWKARVLYENIHDQRDSLRVDINYLMRVPIFGTVARDLPAIFELDTAAVPCVALEDVYGGKLKALATRGEARDLFDASQFIQSGLEHDQDRLRKAFLFYCHTDDATLETVDLEAVTRIDQEEVERSLYPMLRRDERPMAEEMQSVVQPVLARMLERSEEEIEFGTRLEEGSYEPGLLFGETAAHEDIGEHPAPLWRAMHPHGKLPDGEL